MKFSIRKRNKAAVFTVILAFLLFAAPVWASGKEEGPVSTVGLTARGVFESLQCPALEILKKSSRLDMLDYWDADSIAPVKNAMEGLSSLCEVKPDYLKLRITPVSTMEIKVLPLKKEWIVMTIYTVGDSVQASDSQVDFYDAALQPLETSKFLEIPKVRDFFDIPKGSATTYKEIESMIPFPTVAYSTGPGTEILTARLTVEKFVSTDDWNILKLFIKPEIAAEWKGKYRFK